MTCGDFSKLFLLPFLFRITSPLFTEAVKSITAENVDDKID